MRTNTLRNLAARAAATLGALLTLAAVPAAADDTASPAADRIFETRLDAGYRTADTADNRDRIFPYDPLTDGPILGLDLLYLTPQFGSLKLEAGFLDADAWQADLGFNHGSDVGLQVGTRAFTHQRGHTGPVPAVKVDAPPPAGMDVEGTDFDPGRAYRDERRETSAAVKVRIPDYPAHVTASGRIDRLGGSRQMRYFFRSCSTHLCHVDSRTRDLDQVTRQWTLGADAHLGPVDLALSHAAQTYRDDAADPSSPSGDLIGGTFTGDQPADVNPDLRSAASRLTLNTNLTNRVVLSLAFSDGEQKNETAEVSRTSRSAAADLSYRVGPRTLLTARYAYDQERSGDLGAAAAKLRADRNKAQAVGSYATRHQHPLDPEQTRQTGELAARFSPVTALELDARLRFRATERYAIVERPVKTDAFEDQADKTSSTLAGLGARYRPSPALSFDASLGREWTNGVVEAVETTGITRYGLGASWTPGPVFMLRAGWNGFRGENDDPDALQYAYAVLPPETAAPGRRDVSGDAFMAMAAVTPDPAFTLTASWSLTDNGVEQDMLFGSAANAGFFFLGADTVWSGRTQVADLRARWEISRRVALTVDGMWIDSVESYAPDFPTAGGLEENGTVDFTKLLGSLQAEVRLTDALGLTLAAFWTRFDDQADDAGDGTAQGALAALAFRW